MLAIIIYFLWLFWPYIIIVFIGNFITEQILECNNMHSISEEEVDPFKKATDTSQLVKTTTRKRIKSNSKETSDDITEISIDSVENFISSLQDKKTPKYHPCHTEDDLKIYGTKIFYVKPKMSKFFVINEDIFLDVDRTLVEEEQYCEYNLYKIVKTSEGIPEMDGQENELTEEDLTEDLFVTEQTTKNGVIINSNVYLTREQWHTIMQLDKDIFSCTVCQFQCDSATVYAHVRSVPHLRKLDGHRPLKRFDLSITRKINEDLHCAVCNTIYPIKNYWQHENLKSHEETLLTAINKVTDILYDDGHSQKTTQSFNNNNIQAPNNAPHHWLHFYEFSRNEGNSPRTEGYSPRTEGDSPRTEGDSPRTEGYMESHGNETITHSYENTPRSDYSENRGQTKEEPKNFNFRNTFGDIKICEEEETEEYIPPIEGISYASMASKPRVNVPKFLKIDLGTKEVRVKYESWNMVTQIDCNQIYCMVCNTYVLVRFKNKHCAADEHKALLAKCKVVGAFEDYLIRDVNEKLYHCGHCNNLQVKNDIKPHIEKYHPTKNGNIKDINPLQIFPETNPQIFHETRPQVYPETRKAQPLTRVMTEEAIEKLDIFGDYRFCPFGSEMVVTNLSCHTLMLRDGRYVCAICNVVVQGDLKRHVYEAEHIQYITMTPFIRPFQSNLTRAIRGSLHCLLCNALVSVRHIYSHNMSTEHTANLARAFGMRRSEKPTQEVKYQCEAPNEYKTELDRFLNSLSPDSREALSKLTIKNHKGEVVHLSDTDSSISPNPLSSRNSPALRDASQYPTEAKDISPVPSVPNNNTVNYDGNFPPLPASLFPGQMLTVSMVESGLPGVRTGSPVPAFRPPLQLQITGLIDTKTNNGATRIPVSPIRRKEDIEVANDLLSLYKESPVRTKAPEKKRMFSLTESNLGVNIENGTKIEKVEVVSHEEEKSEKIADKTADKTDKKKKTGKGKVEKQPTTSVTDDEEPFKLDEPVLLKVKTIYFRISNTAYQALVHLSNGCRYCFVCSQNLEYSELQAHVEGREHIDNMAKNKFLCNFNGQLLRQIYLMYHCALCNVTMSRRDVKMHLAWPLHLERHAAACKKLNKKILKEASRQGVKEMLIETQKEHVFENMPEPNLHIFNYVQSAKKDFVDGVEERQLDKKKQMIIVKGNMLLISFESWHGIVTTKSGTRCILCQMDLTPDQLHRHIDSKHHHLALGLPFLKHYCPTLARQINPNIINCVICNLELPNDGVFVSEHITGRKHNNNYAAIVEQTAQADCSSDSYKYPIAV